MSYRVLPQGCFTETQLEIGKSFVFNHFHSRQETSEAYKVLRQLRREEAISPPCDLHIFCLPKVAASTCQAAFASPGTDAGQLRPFVPDKQTKPDEQQAQRLRRS